VSSEADDVNLDAVRVLLADLSPAARSRLAAELSAESDLYRAIKERDGAIREFRKRHQKLSTRAAAAKIHADLIAYEEHRWREEKRLSAPTSAMKVAGRDLLWLILKAGPRGKIGRDRLRQLMERGG
jgi:hypothetical protein